MSGAARAGIGAVVITRNAEDDIADCLRSLSFCDERMVVDSFSDDRTVQRALPYAEHVVRREFLHHADQKNWALDRLRTPWALVVDADERVTPALAEELRALARDGRADAYWIYRRNSFFGRFIRGAGWQRDRVLRFFRVEAGRYEERFLHEEVVVREGLQVGRCRHRLLHFSYRDWDSAFDRLLAYSTRGARDRAARGQRTGGWSIALSAAGRFLRQYLLQGGFRDGLHGYVLCTWSAVGIFLRQSKLRLGETEIAPRRGQRDPRGVEVVQGGGWDSEAGGEALEGGQPVEGPDGNRPEQDREDEE